MDYPQGISKSWELKIIVLGEPAVGKTSIASRLLSDSFEKEVPLTHGISVQNLAIQRGGEEDSINIWDFGGQEIMHSIHHLFLTERSLYLLVLDARHDSNPEYWLETITLSGGNSPVLLILNKIDLNPSFDLNRKFLQLKYPNIIGFIRTSCLTGEGLYELRNSINKIHHKWPFKIDVPINWLKVRTSLYGLNKNYITANKFFEICNENEIKTKSEQKQLLTFLSDLGAIINFDRPFLEEIVVLNPQWLLKPIYHILNSKYLIDGNGIMTYELVKKSLEESIEGSPDYLLTFLIRVMSEFEIAQVINNDSILIPDALPIVEPQFSFNTDSSMKFIVEYEFLPKSIMPKLIIALFDDIFEKKYWRSGVLIKNTLLATEALIRTDYSKQTIYIYINGKYSRSYLSLIRNEINRINTQYRNLKYREKVPLPEGHGVSVSYEYLLNLEKHDISTFLPDGVNKIMNVRTLLDGVRMIDKLPSENDVAHILNQITESDQLDGVI
jgi:internalin A